MYLIVSMEAERVMGKNREQATTRDDRTAAAIVVNSPGSFNARVHNLILMPGNYFLYFILSGHGHQTQRA